MKSEKFSLVILVIEVVAIIYLHAAKQQPPAESSVNLKATMSHQMSIPAAVTPIR